MPDKPAKGLADVARACTAVPDMSMTMEQVVKVAAGTGAGR